MAKINPWILSYEAKSYANADYSSCRIDCSLGVNLEQLPEYVLQKVRDLTEEELKHYPHDPEFIDCLIAKFKGLAELDRDNFALGAGSVDLLFTIDKLFLSKGRTALGMAPQFATYVDDVHFLGADYAPYFMRKENGYAVDVREFADFILNFSGDVSMVYVDNPNNPTGQVLKPDEIALLVAAAKERDAAILIDEAYGDFMPAELSAVSLVEQNDHVYVLKTMSKGYGMAGMRLGYLTGPKAGMNEFRKLIPPYNGNGLARKLGVDMLEGGSYLEGLLDATAGKNARVRAAIAGSPMLMAKTDDRTPISLLYTEDDDIDLCEKLRQAGIASVSGVSFEGLGKNSVRLMVPAEKDMPLLIELLKDAAKLF